MQVKNTFYKKLFPFQPGGKMMEECVSFEILFVHLWSGKDF